MGDKLKGKPTLSVLVRCWATNQSINGIDSTNLQNSTGGMNTVLPRDIPSFGVLMMVVGSAYTVGRKSPIGVQLG